jgi:hypothetical protein
MAENKCIQCDSLKTELCTVCEKNYFCKEHTFWYKTADMWEKENICLDCCSEFKSENTKLVYLFAFFLFFFLFIFLVL